MAFLEKIKTIRISPKERITFRLSEEAKDKLKKLITLYPDKYDNEAQAIRAIIIETYNRRVDEYGRRKESAGFELE